MARIKVRRIGKGGLEGQGVKKKRKGALQETGGALTLALGGGEGFWEKKHGGAHEHKPGDKVNENQGFLGKTQWEKKKGV